MTPIIKKRSQIEATNLLTDLKEGTSKKNTLAKLGFQGPRTASSILTHKKSKASIDVNLNSVPKRDFNIFDNNNRGAILSIYKYLFISLSDLKDLIDLVYNKGKDFREMVESGNISKTYFNRNILEDKHFMICKSICKRP